MKKFGSFLVIKDIKIPFDSLDHNFLVSSVENMVW